MRTPPAVPLVRRRYLILSKAEMEEPSCVVILTL
jgi:hypothetical protein